MPSCLVLTAGLGTRLDPITRLVAKPAVPLADGTLIEHVLAWLRRNGVDDVVMNLHHRPASVTSVVGDGTHLGMRVRYSWEQPVLGSAGGPRRALPLLSTDPILIVNGDTLCDFPLAPFTRAHETLGGDVTLAVIPNPDRARYNGIRLGPSNEVLGFIPKGHTEETWHFVGVQIARKSVFAGLPDDVPTETVAGFYREMVAQEPGRIRALPVATTFVDVGTPADYLAAALALGAAAPGLQEVRSSVGSLARAKAGATRGTVSIDAEHRTLVWSVAHVPDDAHLRNCVVAGDVTLPSAFAAENAVVVPASVVRPSDVAEIRDHLAVFPLG